MFVSFAEFLWGLRREREKDLFIRGANTLFKRDLWGFSVFEGSNERLSDKSVFVCLENHLITSFHSTYDKLPYSPTHIETTERLDGICKSVFVSLNYIRLIQWALESWHNVGGYY